jgi:hypothetical protein
MKYVNLNPGESHITDKVVYQGRYLIEQQLGVKVGVFGSDNWMANLTKEPFEGKRVKLPANRAGLHG